jgi:phosphoribosylanthranilate isomerase
MSSVKICGLQQPETVKAILHLPIDHIGFMFAKSNRQVTPKQAGVMIRAVAERRDSGLQAPLTVGVFVNPTQKELTAVLTEAPLDVVQLHGQESPDFCRWIKNTFSHVKVWKVVSVTQVNNLSKNEEANGVAADASTYKKIKAVAALLSPYKEVVDGILLDTFDPVYGGGSGKTFAWDEIPPYQDWCRENGIQLLVAGGLQSDNVGELLDAYAPDGVDVSSGVETDGVKDLNKITSFVERVKHHV